MLGRSKIGGLLAAILLGASSAAAAETRAKPAPEPAHSPARCEPPKFRIVVDVGHTPDSYGALSARNDPEFGFNFRLARLITAKL